MKFLKSVGLTFIFTRKILVGLTYIFTRKILVGLTFILTRNALGINEEFQDLQHFNNMNSCEKKDILKGAKNITLKNVDFVKNAPTNTKKNKEIDTLKENFQKLEAGTN